MNYKDFIIVVPGEPKSIFFEIFFKSLRKIKIKNPIILIASKNLIKLEMKKMNFKKKIKLLKKEDLKNKKLNNNCINLLNINYSNSKKLNKTSTDSRRYISKCFDVAFEIIKKYNMRKFINGPINKKIFLNKKFPGITEYISKKFKTKNNAMLIYNNKLSVCPLTTHLPIKYIAKKITKNLIFEKIKLIDQFYKSSLKKTPRIAVLGLNPHCESIDKFNEDEKIVKPAIQMLDKRKFKVYGPFSADTIFLKQNRNKYDVVLGMYHDQVLSPLKTIYEYDAINITLGLPFIRISPDHGPNINMLGKNKSNPLSLIRAISFLDKN
ncbi:4-hydroxythreonine-4-phosphate dehydrogenase PdxA [Candidatus Pelagibacter sp.]|uniref:4-hydroxythreonine-4-phosphate dehydrogenase PdxA n=1 Tax=Candidatus Pelagibacter sp. TaxID=2024849 RepID=UPI003F8326B8